MTVESIEPDELVRLARDGDQTALRDGVDALMRRLPRARLRNPLTGDEIVVYGKVLNVSARSLGFDADGVVDVDVLQK